MKISTFISSIISFVCPMVFSQAEARVIYTCDKNIPSYYVLSDKGNAFYRNDKADNVTNKLRELLDLNDDTTLGLVNTLTDIAGGFHETYQQYYKGVEVDGKRCSVHYTCDGLARMVNGNLWTIEGIDVFPTKKNGEAKNLAIEAIREEFLKEEKGTSTDVWKSINIDSIVSFKQAKLVVYEKKRRSISCLQILVSFFNCGIEPMCIYRRKPWECS